MDYTQAIICCIPNLIWNRTIYGIVQVTWVFQPLLFWVNMCSWVLFIVLHLIHQAIKMPLFFTESRKRYPKSTYCDNSFNYYHFCVYRDISFAFAFRSPSICCLHSKCVYMYLYILLELLKTIACLFYI